jgi:hypothetical protein
MERHRRFDDAATGFSLGFGAALKGIISGHFSISLHGIVHPY